MKSERRAEAAWVESRKRWQINVQKDGLRKTFTSSIEGRKGKHDAEAKADHWLSTMLSDQRFGDALDAFLEDKSKAVKAQTYAVIQIKANAYLRTIPAGKRLNTISAYDWQGIITEMANNGKAESYCRGMITLIHEFVNYCLLRKWDIEEIRTGTLIVPEGAKEKKEKRALTAEQVNALLALDPDEFQDANLFKLAVLTGLRRGELINLKWADIKDGLLTVQAGKTANAKRTMPLQPDAQTLLQTHKERLFALGRITENVFPDERTALPIKEPTLNKHWGKIQQAINADGITTHELRHTFISVMQGEIPTELLKQIVGHSTSMDTFGVYGHQTEKDRATAKQAVTGAFKKFRKAE